MRFNTLMSAAISGIAVVATAVLGSRYTQQSVQSPWYACIRTWYTPPSWVFPIVWTVLYGALWAAFSFSLLNDAALPTILHVTNLALNVAWCAAFFGRRMVGPALGLIVGNVGVAVAIAGLTKDARVTLLMLPYIAWLLFATALNAGALKKAVDC
jgi:benzodiazapine receptor